MIYVVESGDYFKVGFSNNPKKRISQYKTHNPDITLVATYKGDKDVEKYVHAKFRDSLYRGEWFHKFTGWEDSVDTCIENYKSSYLILESNKEKSVGVKAVEEFLRGDTNNTLRRLFNFCHPRSNFIWSGKRLLTAEDIADLLGGNYQGFSRLCT